MSDLAVSLFGKMQVRLDGKPAPGPLSQKARELLVYLLIHRRAHPREKLASVLWQQGISTQRAKAYLRKALWKLQQSLTSEGPASPAEPAILLVEGDWVQLHPEANVWVDVAAFEGDVAAVRDCRADAMSPEQIRGLEEAATLYTGDLLENWYQDWCLIERERLQNLFLRVLDRLAHCCERRATYDAGIHYGQRTLRIDPARECTHRRLMRLHALAGNRTEALRQYQRCTRVLRRELDVAPTTATQRLHDLIRTDRFPAEPAPDETAPDERIRDDDLRPSAPDRSLRDRLHRIQELQYTLAAVQTQIRDEIEAVEEALRQEGVGQWTPMNPDTVGDVRAVEHPADVR